MIKVVYMCLWGVVVFGLVLTTFVNGFEFGLDEYFFNGSEVSHFDSVYGGFAAATDPDQLMVGLTLIPGAVDKGAGTLLLLHIALF
ncbi:hypothetical protein LIER_43244 [Lithospermum erythrorhizon]|uniref:Uncharacterized protein n=1 Tax=Lithospermum erythrorhizon TaxID=34254 RepID=A0AAV3PTY7_LITER